MKLKFDEVQEEKNAIAKINETFKFRKKEIEESNEKVSNLKQQNEELLALKDNNEKIVSEYIKTISNLKLDSPYKFQAFCK